VNYRILSTEELLRLWSANRNSMASLMAGDEMMNRIERGELVAVPADELETLKENQSEDHP